MKRRALHLSVALLSVIACRGNPGSRAEPLPHQDPRFAVLTYCAQGIGVAEGFQVSTASGTLLERPTGDARNDVKEMLWLGGQRAGDSLRAVAHVQLTSSGAKRTTFDQLSPVAQRVVQRINTECAVGPDR